MMRAIASLSRSHCDNESMDTYRKILSLPILLLIWLSCCSRPERQLSVTRLQHDFEPLQAAFNQDAGKVRLLLLLDPT